MVSKDWSDGDVLYSADLEGYFNLNQFLILQNQMSAFKSDDFTSDTSNTSTNLVYNTTLDEFSSIAVGAATVLEMADVFPTGTDSLNVSIPSLQSFTQGLVKFNYEVFKFYDECNDSSIDAAKWVNATSGGGSETISEDTQIMTVSRSGNSADAMAASVITHATAGNFYGDTHIQFRVTMSASSYGAASASMNMDIYDGTDSVNIKTVTAHDPAAWNAKYDLFFDQAAETVRLFSNGTELAGSPFDISSLAHTWRLKLSCDANGDSGGTSYATIVVYYLRKFGTNTTTVTESLSVDGGSNYTSAVKSWVDSLGTAGYGPLRAKLSCTLAANEGIVINDDVLSAWNPAQNHRTP